MTDTTKQSKKKSKLFRSFFGAFTVVDSQLGVMNAINSTIDKIKINKTEPTTTPYYEGSEYKGVSKSMTQNETLTVYCPLRDAPFLAQRFNPSEKSPKTVTPKKTNTKSTGEKSRAEKSGEKTKDTLKLFNPILTKSKDAFKKSFDILGITQASITTKKKIIDIKNDIAPKKTLEEKEAGLIKSINKIAPYPECVQ